MLEDSSFKWFSESDLPKSRHLVGSPQDTDKGRRSEESGLSLGQWAVRVPGRESLLTFLQFPSLPFPFFLLSSPLFLLSALFSFLNSRAFISVGGVELLGRVMV